MLASGRTLAVTGNEMRLFCRILSTESNDGISLLKRITYTLATLSKIDCKEATVETGRPAGRLSLSPGNG